MKHKYDILDVMRVIGMASLYIVLIPIFVVLMLAVIIASLFSDDDFWDDMGVIYKDN